MPQQRTPRQKQGDGLVPLLVRVSPDARLKVKTLAQRFKTSEAKVVRAALETYFTCVNESC